VLYSVSKQQQRKARRRTIAQFRERAAEAGAVVAEAITATSLDVSWGILRGREGKIPDPAVLNSPQEAPNFGELEVWCD